MKQAATSPGSAPEKGYRYWAFISYSHADKEWASWLHSELETYQVPSALVRRKSRNGPIPSRLFPCFRDLDELPGSSDLSGKIKEALRLSRHIVVICSPKAAVSRWVNEEVRAYKRMGRDDRVLCLITDGEPNASDKPQSGQLECFPPCVRFRVDPDGELTSEPSEPIAADAREGKEGKEDAKLKLLSGLLDVGFDELRQRELRRQRLRRIRTAVTSALVALMLCAGYVLLVDQGARFPGGDAIRTSIDRHEASVFRRAHGDAEIRLAASRQRQLIVDTLWKRWKKDEWFYQVFDPVALQAGHQRLVEGWISGQVFTGVLRIPPSDQKEKELAEMSYLLEDVFRRGEPVEINGILYGWRSGHYTSSSEVLLGSSTSAGASLWLVAAYSVALARSGLIPPEKRASYLDRLRYVQKTCRVYIPSVTAGEARGAWNFFADQYRANEHSTYVATLALLSLLEVRAGGLPWEDSLEKRDELLRDTAQWLVGQFVSDTDPPGWRGAPDDKGPVSDGLTLQIYSELLRAEEEVGIALPPQVLAAIGRHIETLGKRTVDYPITNKTFVRPYLTPEKQPVAGLESTYFIWHAWGVETAVRWLRRQQKHGAPHEDQVITRRTLGHLVIDIGDEQIQRLLTGVPFPLAETVYALSNVAPPQSARP